MHILSIDVGISNLAFCFFSLPSPPQPIGGYEILKWDTINVAEEAAEDAPPPDPIDPINLPTCNYPNRTQSKKQKRVVECGRPALYRHPNDPAQCRCAIHAKKECFVVPTKELTTAHKRTAMQLCELADKYQIAYAKPIKKARLLQLIQAYIDTTCFRIIEQPPPPPPAVNAKKVDLITLGRNLKAQFDRIFADTGKDEIDYVLIENQIGPHAVRMKTMQGMLAQYFIMTGQAKQIVFVSSMRKLQNGAAAADDEPTTTYKERKVTGIDRCKDELQKHCRPAIGILEAHKKKDDLADCFLQGKWYIENRLQTLGSDCRVVQKQ